MIRARFFATVVAWVAACGGQSRSLGEEPASGGSAGTGGASAGSAGAASTAGAAPFDCLVALRIDDCCNSPIAVPAEALEGDSCLVPFSRLGAVPSEVLSACARLQPPSCQVVDCTWGRPPSRVATRASDGTCAFAHECNTVSDCVLATDVSWRCNCPEPAPQALVDGEPCLVSEEEAAAGGIDPTCTSPVPAPDRCAACPSSPPLFCLDGGGLRTCVAGAT